MAAAGILLLSGDGLSARNRWILARTAHFIIVSEASEVVTSEVALELERFREALIQGTWLRPGDATPPTVYLFKSHGSFMKHASPGRKRKARNAGGFFRQDSSRAALLVDASRLTSSLETARHEYVHFVTRERSVLPRWLEEGLAEYLETFETNAEGGRFGTLTAADQSRVAKAVADDVEDVLDAQDFPKGLPGIWTFYDRSLAWVRFLVHGTGQGLDGLEGLVDRLADGEPIDEALEAQYGAPRSELRDRLRRYLASEQPGESTVVVFEVPRSSQSVVFEPLEGVDLDLYLGSLYLTGDSRSVGLAEQRFRAVLKSEPGRGEALAGLAEALAELGRDDAVSHCRAAFAAGATGERLRWVCASRRFESACAGGATEAGENIDEARRWLEPLAPDGEDGRQAAPFVLGLRFLDPDAIEQLWSRREMLEHVADAGPVITMWLAVIEARHGDSEAAARRIAGLSREDLPSGEELSCYAKTLAQSASRAHSEAAKQRLEGEVERVERLASLVRDLEHGKKPGPPE